MRIVELRVAALFATLPLVLGFLFAGPGHAQGPTPPWTFVVMGDTRDRTTDTATGISPDLPLLAEAIAAERPDLVIHTGDLINGYYTSKLSPMHGEFNAMLQHWKAAVKPIYDYEKKTGILIYPVRGNHEDGEFVTDRALREAYRSEIGVFLPHDGPEGEQGLTYSFRYKGARFIALDAYHRKVLGVLRGYINQEWLDEILAKDSPLLTFVYTHPPAFKVGIYYKSPFPDLYSHTGARDTLWASLVRSKTTAFFCGHIHVYTRGAVDGIEQVVVGNGGANPVSFILKNLDPRIEQHFPKENVAAADIKTGYLVMTVDEGKGQVTGVQKLWDAKAQRWETGDTFTLSQR